MVFVLYGTEVERCSLRHQVVSFALLLGSNTWLYYLGSSKAGTISILICHWSRHFRNILKQITLFSPVFQGLIKILPIFIP